MLSVQELTNSGLVLKSEKIKRAVLTALADSEMVKILDAAMHQSKSVIQIVRETGVSHSTAYRKIKWLIEERLLIIDKTEITQDGRKFSLFRTILKSFNVKYEYNKVVIEAEQNLDTIRKITENFFSLSEREGFQQVKMGNLEL
jgi:DNA-binding transcriptional ArsR family regulator